MLKGEVTFWSVHFFCVLLQSFKEKCMLKTLLISILIIAISTTARR